MNNSDSDIVISGGTRPRSTQSHKVLIQVWRAAHTTERQLWLTTYAYAIEIRSPLCEDLKAGLDAVMTDRKPTQSQCWALRHTFEHAVIAAGGLR